MHRRALLTTGAASLSAMLAGCLGGFGRGATATTTQGLRLQSLAAPGSPGGPISIRPPGKVVLLDFFATWCAPCKPEMANLGAARARFSEADVFIVSITSETDEAAITQFWNRYDGNWPVVMDPDLEAIQRYEVKGIPTIVVLTPDGTETMRHRGLAGEDKIISALEAALDAAGMG